MPVVLLSTYDLGHQPFGLASPAQWLKEVGATVHCVDLAVRPFSSATSLLSQAQLIAVYLLHLGQRPGVITVFRLVKGN